MTNLTDLIIPSGLNIMTTSGDSVALPPGMNVFDLIPHSGSDNQPLWRISVGQPRDSRFPEAHDQFFLTRKVRKTDERTGQAHYEVENLGPLGAALEVWPVGMAANRSYLPPYDPNVELTEALCHSENFAQPDARYAGKFSTQCCAIDPNTKRLVAVCPMARWGQKDPKTGKSTPPECSEQYVLAVAISVEINGEQRTEIAECYFKSSSATEGKNLTQLLRSQELRGEPLYAHPVALTIKAVGQGNTYVGTLLTEEVHEFAPEDTAGLEAGVARWQEALRVRADRAARMPEEPGLGNTENTYDVINGNPPVVPYQPNETGKGLDFNKALKSNAVNTVQRPPAIGQQAAPSAQPAKEYPVPPQVLANQPKTPGTAIGGKKKAMI